MKQLFILFSILLGWMEFTAAQVSKPVAGPRIVLDSITTPTTINDLFVPESGNAQMAPRLNPRAVSFVADYMEKTAGTCRK